MDDGPEGNDPLAARILLKGDLPVAHPAGLLAFLSRRLNRQRQPLSAGYAGALVAGNHLRVAALSMARYIRGQYSSSLAAVLH